MGEYIDAEIKVDKLKGAFAGYFQQYDALLCPVIPFTAPPPGLEEYVVNGRLRGELEQIQFLLGHVSVQTTER